jgi:hypothetical protein
VEKAALAVVVVQYWSLPTEGYAEGIRTEKGSTAAVVGRVLAVSAFVIGRRTQHVVVAV